jgi:hypothetical protein
MCVPKVNKLLVANKCSEFALSERIAVTEPVFQTGWPDWANFSPIGQLFILGCEIWKLQKKTKFSGFFFHGTFCVLILTKMNLYRLCFGSIYHKPIWSPCLQTSSEKFFSFGHKIGLAESFFSSCGYSFIHSKPLSATQSPFSENSTMKTINYSDQGCQMVYFQTKIPTLSKFWRALQWKMLVYFIYI